VGGDVVRFSRLLELRAHDPGPFNYLIAEFSEWGATGVLYLTFDTALGAAGLKMTSSFGTRG
jgi:hypothetical protein